MPTAVRTLQPRRAAAGGVRRRSSAAALLLWAAATAAVVLPARAQAPQGEEPWFGLSLPPPFQPHAAPVLLGRDPAPAVVPPGEERHRELAGEVIRADLETIVQFSKESREHREVGAGQLWGRIAGLPSNARTIAWAAGEFRAAGIERVEVQSFEQDDGASLWLPTAWEVRLLGDPAFGAGSRDVILESAMPVPPSELPGGILTAPLVYVGTGSAAELAHVDVADKVAIQRVTPQAHMVFERSPTVPRAQELFRRGAVAVINVVALPGNERARDFSNCGGPCFNLGGRDGHFLESVLQRAAEAAVLDRLAVRIRLDTGRRTGMSAENAVAVIPGTRSQENIIINAHADAWFDGAGDNGDGLAVLIALARHFARPDNRPERTLVFVASAGHHTTGLSGPRNFVAMNPELTAGAVLVLNIEHVAQRNVSPARSVGTDGYRDWVADAAEAPVVAGITNGAPFLETLVEEGIRRYGANLVAAQSTMASGEGAGYAPVGAVRVTFMQAPPLYHTSGEVLDVISTPGLERMARFLAHFIRQVDTAESHRIDPR